MKLTKFVHSCVLIETPDRTVLFDPGNFSWDSGIVDVEKMPIIDDIVITHEHADHFSEDFVRALALKFPDALWTTNKSIAEKLPALGAKNITTESSEYCIVRNIPHGDVVPFGVPVDHIAVDWNNLVTHPGDTLDFDSTMQLLHLPITAPWGTTVDAVKKMIELKPKYVLPIHEWLLRDEWIKIVYSRLEGIANDNGIKLLLPTDGQPVEVDL